jgi:hypothetical protein
MPESNDYRSEVKEALIPNKVLADRLLALISTNTNVMIELLESMKRLESAITGVPPVNDQDNGNLSSIFKDDGANDQLVLNLNGEEE